MKTRCFFFLLGILLLYSCSSIKNTGGTRWYHSFNTRYNIYFNGNEAYNQALKTQIEGYKENYSEMILMYPVSALPKDKSTSGGAFDKAIEKAVKAIKMHSIQTKPERKSGNQQDPKYKEFLKRKEYNPFLYNAWFLMAKSQFYNGDFLEAASSFSYISRLYESQPEIATLSKIWKARCYSEMGWYYEADDILSKLIKAPLTKDQRAMFSKVYADYLIKQKQYDEAIPYLKIANQTENNKRQRTRQKYLLGQLYASTGQKSQAYKTFGEVSSSNAPYIVELSAKIRQTEVFPGGDINKMSKRLNQMAKSPKNTDYTDQIYYALGNVYMTVPDTTKAIQSYEKGVEKSKSAGIDKALIQVRLGDIYFNQRKYLKAQPNYSEALGQLKKGDEAYPRISKRSEALDALVVHAEAVDLQDSLQRLSRMTEEERMTVVKKIIADLIKKEKEEQKKAQQEAYQAKQEALQGQQQANRPATPAAAGITPPGEAGTFYFYNPQIVAIGKTTFQQKWGRRNLEDDWRRRNKTGTSSPDANPDAALADTTSVAGTDSIASGNSNNADASSQSTDVKKASSDPKDPQFYLQQIPVTDEDIAASNLIISDGLFNMGIIYKEMLDDNHLALETFESLNTRFPDNINKQMAYYYTYLIYWQEGNMEMANLYKSKIRSEFPDGELAKAMADPDYEYNQKMMNVIQDSIYQQTYTDYLDGNIKDIRQNYEWISTKYNQSKIMPKFMFLNALTFAITNEPDTFKVLLKTLIDKYPNEDVGVLSSEIMKGFQRGLVLSASGDNMLARGSLFNIRFGKEGEDAASDSTLVFSEETNKPHELLLVYPKGSINDNLLLYTIAGFNFGNFMVNDFGLEKTVIGEIGLLRIKGFNNQDQVIQYLRKIRGEDGYAQEWGQRVIMVPISSENYDILMKGKSLGEYMTFFEDHFAQGNESLIAQWHTKQLEEMEVVKEEQEENLLPESEEKATKETQPPKTTLPADTIQTTLPADSIPAALSDSLSTKTGITSEKVVDEVNTIYDKATEEIDNTSNAINSFASDPIRGFLNLFKRNKPNNAIDEFAKQQEKEDKDRKKELKKEQAEKDKAAKIVADQQAKEQAESQKKQAEEAKDSATTKQQQQKDLKKQKAIEKKQKDADAKKQAKEKKEAQAKAQKKKKEDQAAKDKARKEESKRKAKEREDLRKQKEKERKERSEQQKKQSTKK